VETKICKQCGKELPATEEYFYKQTRGTLFGKCKECVKARVPKRPLSNKYVDNGDGTTSMYFVDRDKNVDYTNIVTIDTADVEKIKPYVWVFHSNVVYTNLKNYKQLRLTVFLTDWHGKEKVVFLNKNRLDYRRSNLAIGWGGRLEARHKEFVAKKEENTKKKTRAELLKIIRAYFRSKAKMCPTCGRLLPLTDEHWYKNKSSKDGLSAECKECDLTRKRKKGSFLPRELENEYIDLHNGVSLIVLKNRKREVVGYAKIDSSMVEKCKPYKWHKGGKGHSGNTDYVINCDGLPLHRFVIGEPPKGYTVDHINRDGLDNRVSNLRFATFSQNNMNKGVQKNNSSGYTGVEWHKKSQKWRARIKINRKSIALGEYKKLTDAVKARKEAEIKYFGEFRDRLSEMVVAE
jgi:hypothetical protein